MHVYSFGRAQWYSYQIHIIIVTSGHSRCSDDTNMDSPVEEELDFEETENNKDIGGSGSVYKTGKERKHDSTKECEIEERVKLR